MQWPLARHLQVQVEYTAVADRSNEYARLGFTELWKFQDFVGSERQVAEIPGSRENGLFRIRNARVVGSNPIPGTIFDNKNNKLNVARCCGKLLNFAEFGTLSVPRLCQPR